VDHRYVLTYIESWIFIRLAYAVLQDQLYPLVMGCADRAYEGGNNFPDAPWFAFYVIHYWMERKHSSVWRFNPSTTWGDRRPFYFHA
jgi:hypothetical protein